MTNPLKPFDQAANPAIRHGPCGLKIIEGGIIPPDSLAIFKDLFDDKYSPSFRDVWIDSSEVEKDFFMDFLDALKKTQEGLDVLVKALSTQSTISDILEDRVFDLPVLIRDMSQEAREQLLLDEDHFAIPGILEFDRGDGDVIDRTICGASDPQQKIKLITAYDYHSGYIIKWLDQMSPEDRDQCLSYKNVLMSLGSSFFYDQKEGRIVEHALDRWEAHHLRRVLHYAGDTLTDTQVRIWVCIAPVIYTDEQMGDFQAPPLPPDPGVDLGKLNSVGRYSSSEGPLVPGGSDDDFDIPF